MKKKKTKKKSTSQSKKNKILYTEKQEKITENHTWQFNLYNKHEMNNMLLTL